jgi:hypothetical protein
MGRAELGLNGQEWTARMGWDRQDWHGTAARRHGIIGKTGRWDDGMGDGMAWARRVERPRRTQ